MNITFLGATKTVTGSNFLVEGAGKKFIVDCGMYQGSTKDEMKNSEPFLFDVNDRLIIYKILHLILNNTQLSCTTFLW